MTANEIERLVLAAEASGIAELDLQQGGARLTLRFAEPMAPRPSWDGTHASALTTAADDLKQDDVAAAPSLGIVRLDHPMSAKAELAQGTNVAKGDILAYVEAGPLLHPVTAPRDGALQEVLVEDGAVVGYGTVIVVLR